jgi:hypothetical protein
MSTMGSTARGTIWETRNSMTNGMERAEDQIMLRNSGTSFGNKVKDASVWRTGCERIIFEVSCAVAAAGVVLSSPSKAFPVVLIGTVRELPAGVTVEESVFRVSIEPTMALFAEGAKMMDESSGLVCSIGLTMATFARREEGGPDTTDELC